MSDISPNQEGQLRELIAQGNLIAAIKLYREISNVGLAEAKDAVEAIQRGEPVNAPTSRQLDPRNDALLEEQIKQFLIKRQKIEAVKIYREAHNCGLKDAKDAVDAIEARMRMETRESLPVTPAISDDPFAEDTQRNRKFLILGLAFLLVVIAGLSVFLFSGRGF